METPQTWNKLMICWLKWYIHWETHKAWHYPRCHLSWALVLILWIKQVGQVKEIEMCVWMRMRKKERAIEREKKRGERYEGKKKEVIKWIMGGWGGGGNAAFILSGTTYSITILQTSNNFHNNWSTKPYKHALLSIHSTYTHTRIKHIPYQDICHVTLEWRALFSSCSSYPTSAVSKNRETSLAHPPLRTYQLT